MLNLQNHYQRFVALHYTICNECSNIFSFTFQDIQNYLDEATNGVIYFSLGSTLKSNMMSRELKQNILETFKELPYNVLWKMDHANLTDLPENIKIAEWLPQQDILGMLHGLIIDISEIC